MASSNLSICAPSIYLANSYIYLASPIDIIASSNLSISFPFFIYLAKLYIYSASPVAITPSSNLSISFPFFTSLAKLYIYTALPVAIIPSSNLSTWAPPKKANSYIYTALPVAIMPSSNLSICDPSIFLANSYIAFGSLEFIIFSSSFSFISFSLNSLNSKIFLSNSSFVNI